MKLSLRGKFKLYTCPPGQHMGREMQMALLSKTPVKTLHKKIPSLCREEITLAVPISAQLLAH